MTTNKYCPGCKKEKPTDSFPKNRSTKDGFYTYCRECNAEQYAANKKKILQQQKEYYEINKSDILARQSEYRETRDKNTVRSYNQEYRAKNTERIKKRKQEYYQENKKDINAAIQKNLENNPEKHKERNEYLRQYRQKYLERERTRSKQYQDRNRDELLEKKRQYQKSHPETVKASKHNRKARIRGNGGTFRAADWRNLKALYSNTCLCCGRMEPEIKLVPDHVIPLAVGGINEISNIQPLCEKCNLIKGIKTVDYRPNYNKPSQ